MIKEYLTNMINTKKTEVEKLQERSNASQDIAEVRAIGDNLSKLKKEIEEAEKQLADLEEEERAEVPADATLRNGVVVGATAVADDDMEYRKAFMNYVVRNVPIPAEFRDDANTLTTDVASVIPTVVINRIVEKMEKIGYILPLITKTSYPAGVEVPTSSVKPVASWVNEGASSDRQKKTTGKVSFTYHKLRCEISMSMEVSVMSISAFEDRFVENVAQAMVKTIEQAVISGDGSGKPKGILAETPVTGQALNVVAGALSYGLTCDMEGAIPEEYESTAKWVMTKKTFMKFQAIVDDNGQPVARVNYGLGGKPERTLLGRDVVLATAYMDTLVPTTYNKVVAFAFDFSDYMLNTVYDMGISKKQDWDTEDMLTKAVMSVDGKVVSKDSLVTLTNVQSV